MSTLIQNSAETCLCVTVLDWTVAIDSPASLNRLASPITAMTLANLPKSVSSSTRARIASDAIWTTNLMPCAPSVTTPPLTERRFRSFWRCSVSKMRSRRSAVAGASSIGVFVS